jgi:hypothetical protein
MGKPFDPRKFPNLARVQRDRGPYYQGSRGRGGRRRRTSRPYLETVIILSIITFLVVFQTDIGGRGHAPGELFRERPAVAVSRPFSGCNEARAAGAAPVYRGDPGYGPHLDGDGDGVGCEPYHRY